MSKEIKAGMLARIAHRPRELVEFTQGPVHSTVSARHIQKYLEEMIEADLIEEDEGKYHITDRGLRALEPPNIAPPKTWGSLSTTGLYVPPKVYVRAGGERFLELPSRGMGT